MSRGSLKQLLVVMVTILVVVGMVPAIGVGAVPEDDAAPQPAISGSDFINASDDVEVWNRAALPLRTNPNVNADTRFRSVDLKVTTDEFSRARLDKNTAAVYDDEAEIQLQFTRKTFADTSQFANQDAQLVAAHIEEDTEAARELLNSNSALTVDRALDLLTADNVNDNVHFTLVEDYGTLDGDGELTERYDLEENGQGAGFYVFFLVQDYRGGDSWGVTDEGFEVSDGDLSVKNKSRVLGLDVATVHQQPAEASLSQNQYTAGEDITFDVDANQGKDVTHTVVVYDKNKLEGSEVVIEISGKIDRDISPDQVTVRREIEAVNGVAAISGNPGVFGLGNLNDGRASGLITGGQVIDFIAEQANADAPLDATTANPKTLDASINVSAGPDQHQVTVETLEDWSPGRYKYVYVATGDDSSEITTTEGEFTIRPSMGMGRRASTDGDGVAEVDFSDESEMALSGLSVSFPDSRSRSISVVNRNSPPEGVPTLEESMSRSGVAYPEVTISGDSYESAEIRATVRKSELDGPASEFSIYHYVDGEWVELDTTVAAETETTVTFSATTSGASPFAIGRSLSRADDDDDDGYVKTGTPMPTETAAETTVTVETQTDTPTATETAPVTEQPATETETAAADANDAPSTEAATTSTTSTQFPGLGVVVTLVAFVVVALLGRRRGSN